MNRFFRSTCTVALAAASLGTIACDDVTSADDSGNVTVAFSAATSTDASASSSLAAAPSFSAAPGEIVLTGDNGILTITDVAFIVGEFKLDRGDDACDSLAGIGNGDDDDDDCEEFETGTFFVQLPLTGGTTPVTTQSIPSGTYVEMKFEVEDADLSEAEDDDDGADILALLAEIEAAGYTDWPADASLVVAGRFTPTDGPASDFVAYFEAEIKIEMAFDPPLVIDGEPGTLDIQIDPAAWFSNLDGSVTDLSEFDFVASGGQVVEFEAKMEHGFTKIELEGFDD
ncbi:MAG TPA: hypothetical protein VMN78_06020 [Longimicrobiales bacterium]|nr:hypothetical protein [Longimicrobiales bacterium]